MTDLSTILFCLARFNLRKKKNLSKFIIDWKRKKCRKIISANIVDFLN